MNRNILVAAAAVILALLILGAALPRLIVGAINRRPDTDVTAYPNYNFTSFAGTTWKTKVKTAIVNVESYKGKRHLALVVPKHFDTANPEYTPNDTARIVSRLPAGANLRITQLMHDNGNWGGLWVMGSIKDGTNTEVPVQLDDLLLGKNQFIWPGWSSSTNWGVDPEMLEQP